MHGGRLRESRHKSPHRQLAMLNALAMECDRIDLRRSMPVQKRQQIFETVPVRHSGTWAIAEVGRGQAATAWPTVRQLAPVGESYTEDDFRQLVMAIERRQLFSLKVRLDVGRLRQRLRFSPISRGAGPFRQRAQRPCPAEPRFQFTSSCAIDGHSPLANRR